MIYYVNVFLNKINIRKVNKLPRKSKAMKDLEAKNQRMQSQLTRLKARDKARAELIAEGYKRSD